MTIPFSHVHNSNKLPQISSAHIQILVNPNVDHLFETRHAARDVHSAGSNVDGLSRTVDLALSSSFQTCLDSVRKTASSNHPGKPGFRVSHGAAFSAALTNTSATFAASALTVPPGLTCLSSLMISWLPASIGVIYYYPPVDWSAPRWDSPRFVECEATKEPHGGAHDISTESGE